MKRIVLVAILATFSLSAFAQGGERGPFLTNKFKDNWFISAGGGINIYFGETDNSAKNRIAPALDVAVGKWFTPAIGARLQYSGLQAKGSSPYLTPFTTNGPLTSKGYLPKKMMVHFIHADFLWNISSQFGGYKETRIYELIPYIGVGAAMAINTQGQKTQKNEIAFTAGLINKFRVARFLDVNLELRGMLVNQRFDDVVGGKSGEGMLSVTAGLTYKFNKRGFDKPQKTAPADYTPYNDRIRLLENDLAASKKHADQLAKDLAAAKNVKHPEVKTEYLVPDMAIFFPLGKSTISQKELVNLNYIAEAIKKLPAGTKVYLDGNADSKTGNAAVNMRLSEARGKAVYDALIKAGVDPNMLQIVPHGDKKEPFDSSKPELNRVLIIEH